MMYQELITEFTLPNLFLTRVVKINRDNKLEEFNWGSVTGF